MNTFDRWKFTVSVVVILLGIFFLYPNFLPKKSLVNFPGWLPQKQINLGLDLQGGSYLLLEIEVDALIKEKLDSLVSEVRTQFRSSGNRIAYTDLGVESNQVLVRVINNDNFDRAKQIISDLSQPIQSSNSFMGSGKKDLDIKLDNSTGFFRISLTEEAIAQKRRSAVEQSIEIIRRRVDETGTREPSIQRQGDDRVLVKLPGLDDPERIKKLLGKTARLTFQLVVNDVSVDGRIPPGMSVYKADDSNKSFADKYVLQKRVMLSGENLLNANPTIDQQSGKPAVAFRLNASGSKRFGDITTEKVGYQFAIVLDGKVISAPVIRQPITGGNGIITGSFSVEEANDLAVLLRAGALPAPLTILEERTVGPGLGADSVAAGKIACIVAFIAIIIFMIISYGIFGVIANISLIVNLILIGGVLSLLQATLTLPGIAGIVLTIGMAVDANVLIFERIREEIVNGKTPIAAVNNGYAKAITTIIDANITTLIAAVLLFSFGSGPVKGFSVTLALGILSSMFTAITLSKLIIFIWLRRIKPKTLPI